MRPCDRIVSCLIPRFGRLGVRILPWVRSSSNRVRFHFPRISRAKVQTNLAPKHLADRPYRMTVADHKGLPMPATGLPVRQRHLQLVAATPAWPAPKPMGANRHTESWMSSSIQD